MTRSRISWLAVACALLLLCLPLAQASEWWNWRGPAQNGFSPEKNLPGSWSPDPMAKDNNLVWKAPYGSRSTPLVMNGRVYFINYSSEKIKRPNGEIKDAPESIQEQVMCLDANTGKVIWQYKFNVWHTDIVTTRLGWTNMAGDPATGNVYSHGTQGMLIAFDKDGKVLWQHSMAEEFGRFTGYGGRVTSPVVDGDLVVLGMNNSAWGDFAKGANRYIAFDKNNGSVVWWSSPCGQPKNSYYSVPIGATIKGQRQIISGCSDGGVYGIQAHTGVPVWGYVFAGNAVNSSPVVDGSLVYCGQGEENPDNNIQGRVVCVDASQVENGQAKLVWKKDGVKARYASPIIHAGRLYMPDDTANLYCMNGATGKILWKYHYGRDARGSPVLADGKIYVGEVNSVFHILKPGPKKCVSLHKQSFNSADGISEVEINGSPAVADGRVYFSTSEETYCIGNKEPANSKPAPPPAQPKKSKGPMAHLQVLPAEVVLHPGQSTTFTVRGFDADGFFVDEVKAETWLLPTPPLPPGAKQSPPPLDGTVKDGVLTVSPKKASQAGYVIAKAGTLTGKARVRVAPTLPYTQDFSHIPDGAVPGGWVNTAGKFKVVTLKDGEKVLAKVNTIGSPLIYRGNAYIGMPDLHDYTIESDVMGTTVVQNVVVGGQKQQLNVLPDMGVVANRYTLYLSGGIQKLRLNSWSALPRVDRTIQFNWKSDTWYRLKLTVEVKGGKGIIKGKCWERGKTEPAGWSIELTDDYPNTEGAPALYGYAQGIPDNGGPGTGVYFDNVLISPNKK
jgi:outer membrane protein assembly factor BamB